MASTQSDNDAFVEWKDPQRKTLKQRDALSEVQLGGAGRGIEGMEFGWLVEALIVFIVAFGGD